jgi:antirestriction protein ArdC
MLSKEEAVKSLIKIFESQTFPEQIALTIIRRREDDPLIKMPCQKYSLGNRLIMAFIGKTELCGTYHQWQEVGRQVRKGSRAFGIYAPLTKTVTDKDAAGNETVKTVLYGFKPIPVFPVESTDGEPLEKYDYTPEILPPFYDICEKLGITVYWKPASRPAYGWYSPASDTITMQSEDWAVFYHEACHSIRERVADTKDIATEEIIAELTSAVLMAMNGINSYQKQAYEYISRYCQDKSPDKVLQTIFKSLNAVEEVVNIILNGKLPDPADNKAEPGFSN